MEETVGKYKIELLDSDEALITPLSKWCRIKEPLFISNDAVNLKRIYLPNYVRDYINRKRNYSGMVYLIHFDEPYEHARHYIGFSKNFNKRMLEHAAGTGSRLMQVVTEAGITWRVAEVWYGDRYLERRFKRQKNSARFCPICASESDESP